MDRQQKMAIRHYAAFTLAERVGRVCELAPKVRQAESTEPVHQMRVASRRLRAALAVFNDALPRKRVKRWRKEVRQLTTALGNARDTDVQIAFAEDYLAELPDDAKRTRPGIQRLHLRLTQQRQRLQPAVNKVIDQLESAALVTKMPDELRQMMTDTRPADLADADFNPADDPQLRNYARQVITDRLDEMLGYAPYVEQPAMAEQLHQMRIAAKHLRYTMELFCPVFQDRLNAPIKRTRKLQNALGDLHDLDLWLDLLPQFIEEERQRTEQYFGHLRSFKRLEVGLAHMLESVKQQRDQAYQTVVTRWRRSIDKGTFAQLREALREPIITPAEPTAPSPLDAKTDAPPPNPRPVITEN